METITHTENELCTRIDADDVRIRVWGNFSPTVAGELLELGNDINASVSEDQCLFNVADLKQIKAMDGRIMLSMNIFIRRSRSGGARLRQAFVHDLSRIIGQKIK